MTEAACGLAWEYFDHGQAEETDVIGPLMPGETYRELLGAFFERLSSARAPIARTREVDMLFTRDEAVAEMKKP